MNNQLAGTEARAGGIFGQALVFLLLNRHFFYILSLVPGINNRS